MRIILPMLAVMGITALATHAHAEDTTTVLHEITDTADRLCGYVGQSGHASSAQITGDVKAELNGLAKRLADLGITGTGGLNSTEYEGVLQQELTAALRDVRQCKITVFDTLQSKLIPTPAPPSPALGPQPRHLDQEAAAKLATSVKGSGISVMITAPSDPEVRAYEGELFQALHAGGVVVQPVTIDTMIPTPFGVAVRPNGHDAQRLVSGLRAAGITPTIDDDPLPVPGSIQDQFKNFIGLIVGFRTTR